MMNKDSLVCELYGIKNELVDMCCWRSFVEIKEQKQIKDSIYRACDLIEMIVDNSGAYNLFIRRTAVETRDFVRWEYFSESNCEKQTINGETLYVIPHEFLMNAVIRVLFMVGYVKRFNYERYDRNDRISIDEASNE